MNTWLRRFALLLALLASTVMYAPQIVQPTLEAVQSPKSITVYVTRTGEKYHRDGCQHLRRSRIPMSLDEAAKRFDPCKVCRPPVR